MTLVHFVTIAFFGGVMVIVVLLVIASVRQSRMTAAGAARSEALFRSMFPELQPYFHPLKLIEFVRARRMRGRGAGGSWKRPPGFEVDRADVNDVDGHERVRLLNETGAVLGEFIFEESDDGGVLRVGKGKLTVSIQDAVRPRVRYWHPDREFKWKNGQWTFQSRMADRDIESGDSTSFSSDSSSSSSSMARGAAAGGAIVAAGGAFDGGGASAAWDGASAGSASESSDSGGGAFEGSTSSATAY